MHGRGDHGGTGIGQVYGNVAIHAGPPRLQVGQAAYLEQVRRIAPPDPPGLLDRDQELAELAGFCLDTDRGPYVWWRAGPWAGKSALMSTFVLHPPEPVAYRVRIVSFFITARLAAQDTREAFTTVVLQQLAEITGQDLPPALSEDIREAVLLDLLTQAAKACQAGGGRLVLVIDGLDEDRGVTLGPHARSIAALLPMDPPAGMRVIVAGRPNPPIPDDVPGHHPLRDPGIIRLLSDSPHARDLQRLGKSELRRLLDGTPTERDLLGLLTAARGGLSGPDLEELTSTPLWEIEKTLHTVAGRTFTRRGATYTPGTGPEVYLLGHEELQNAATSYLREARLAGYRDRIHAWAGTYRARGWPAGTPEYLLRGYFRLLAALGDLPRLTALAVDTARHDRMLDLTGGDAAALDEIRTTLDLLVAQDTPDLTAALHLAWHRDQLTDRNTHIPTGLPAVWVALGHPQRGQALARSITHPYEQAQALAAVAGALAQAGRHDQAEQIARSITDPYGQAQALAAVAGALAQAGRHDQAEQIARSITDPSGQARALAAVAGALAQAGRHDQAVATAAAAEQIARSITDPSGQARALAAVAGALADGGDEQAASCVAAAACAVGRWTDSVRLIVQLDSAAADYLVGLLL